MFSAINKTPLKLLEIFTINQKTNIKIQVPVNCTIHDVKTAVLNHTDKAKIFLGLGLISEEELKFIPQDLLPKNNDDLDITLSSGGKRIELLNHFVLTTDFLSSLDDVKTKKTPHHYSIPRDAWYKALSFKQKQEIIQYLAECNRSYEDGTLHALFAYPSQALKSKLAIYLEEYKLNTLLNTAKRVKI